MPISLGSNDPADLERLFSGDLETVRCPACGYETGEEPGVAVGCDDPAGILVTVPPSATEGAVLIDALRQQVGDRGNVEVVPSIAALREAVAVTLRPHIAFVRELLALVAGGDPAAALSDWPRLTPPVFATAALGLRRPGLGLDLPERTGSRPTADVLAQIQADLYVVASMWWMADPHRATLEVVLHTWVDDSTLLPGAIERLDAKLDETGDDTPWVVHYSQEALRATVHRNAGTPNPRKLDWAQLFVGFEVASRTGEWEADSPLPAQAVSGERAAATLDLEATWVVAGEMLRRVLAREEPDAAVRVDAVDAACEKAGHPGLVPSLMDGRGVT